MYRLVLSILAASLFASCATTGDKKVEAPPTAPPAELDLAHRANLARDELREAIAKQLSVLRENVVAARQYLDAKKADEKSKADAFAAAKKATIDATKSLKEAETALKAFESKPCFASEPTSAGR